MENIQITVREILDAKYDLEKIVSTATENFRDRTGLIPSIEISETSISTNEGVFKNISVRVNVEL